MMPSRDEIKKAIVEAVAGAVDNYCKFNGDFPCEREISFKACLKVHKDRMPDLDIEVATDGPF